MCGVLGTFVVVRRISLVGDAISHAVLPGVVLGFVISSQLGDPRNPWIIFGSATIVGLISMIVVRQIIATTRLKADAALGIVLSGFFGIGLFMKRSMLDLMDSAGGLDSFLFGNMATISETDLQAVVIVGVVLTTLVLLLMRPFILVSFDSLFAETLGYPVKLLNLVFYTLLTITIVVSLQAVGVVLVSAMLIIPAATAYLLTDRKIHMMLLSMFFGAGAGVSGSFISASVSSANIANGAAMTLVAASFFFITCLLAPRHGIVAKWLKSKRQRHKVTTENALKAIYKLVEPTGDPRSAITINDYQTERRLETAEAKLQLKALKQQQHIEYLDKQQLTLTPDGLKVAQTVVRNHRLWELYLTSQANYQADHVHDDAELIEHLLDEETVRQLEAELNFPTTDPHGMPIPRPEAS